MKRKLMLTLVLTAVLTGSNVMFANATFAATDDVLPDGTYTMDLETMASSFSASSLEDPPVAVDQDTYDESESVENLDPALVEEATQFLEYSDQMAPLLEYEKKAWTAYYKNDYVNNTNRKQEYALVTNTIIPNYKKFLTGIKQIKPTHPELAKMHAKYIKGATLEMEGFLLFQKYVSKTKLNDDILDKSNAKLDVGGDLLLQFDKEMEAYISKFLPAQ
ncbi:hypothetical protein QCD85_14795 [Paenibacillus sp. PsM32]|uniref:hypothetical protein n=1 Tax=unclassified Paenibacillus TaxID=185978 RepID=UPI002365600E|nr:MULTISPECIES: hypothetical protein [unclassified Paenibacillus]MDN4619373.1 hypothetical protein [Paenibacillus sp. PsM32]MDQ1237086.1 hypothetical protein [Paenibacillus sp. SORGH_AS_0306]MDR6109446.1 hypothetical protein [Paenibacillus sp. SORGH_AS_0338]WDF50434.1 hypothetical protein PQ460_21075 [Paenibacillus sp. KACC 21273]